MQFASVNYLAVFVAAVAGWLVGAVWYGVLSKPWVAAQGKTMEGFKQQQAGKRLAFLPFVLVFISNLIMAMMLYGIMKHVGPFTIRAGLISGALIWFGFLLTTMTVNNAFAGRKATLTAIDSVAWLGALLIIGAVVGGMGR